MTYSAWSVVFGEQPSTAKWNILGTNDAHFYDLFGEGGYLFKAYASTTTTLTDESAVQITLASESYDPNGDFASNEYTAPVAGYYHFNGSVKHQTASVSPVESYTMIYKNSAEAIRGWSGPAGTSPAQNVFPVSGQLLLSASDTIQLYHYHNSNGNEVADNDEKFTFLSGFLIQKS